VNYFLHTGHLSIAGHKMSKSLKNFTTIKASLERGEYTPRGMRVVFLLGNWRDGLEVTEDLKKAALAWEEKVTNFFIKVKDTQMREAQVSGRSNGTSNGVQPPKSELDESLLVAQKEFCKCQFFF
jgi:cysteinyl-tRNA synthetase